MCVNLSSPFRKVRVPPDDLHGALPVADEIVFGRRVLVMRGLVAEPRYVRGISGEQQGRRRVGVNQRAVIHDEARRRAQPAKTGRGRNDFYIYKKNPLGEEELA